jgi:hypothetical protein
LSIASPAISEALALLFLLRFPAGIFWRNPFSIRRRSSSERLGLSGWIAAWRSIFLSHAADTRNEITTCDARRALFPDRFRMRFPGHDSTAPCGAAASFGIGRRLYCGTVDVEGGGFGLFGFCVFPKK